MIDEYVEAYLDAKTDEQRQEVTNHYVGLVTLEEVLPKIAELIGDLDGQQELVMNMASMFTVALADTIVQTGLISNPDAFSEAYINNLDKGWDKLNEQAQD